jgi:hypothetical protein
MRLNIDFWVKCAKFQKEVKERTYEEAWKEVVEPRLAPPTIKQIQTGSWVGDPKRDAAYAKVAWDEVYLGIPRPYASPEDVKDVDRDPELKRLEAEKKVLEKDKKIEDLKKEIAELKKVKKVGKRASGQGQVSAEG